MGKHIQACDFYRDDQGRLCLGLYNPEQDTTNLLTLSKNKSRCFLLGGPSITNELVAFLEENWGDQPPEILEADSALRWVGVEQYLASKGVALKTVPPYSMALRALERKLRKFRQQGIIFQGVDKGA